MNCPNCKSENIITQVVIETKIKNKHKSVFWWVFIGWWLIPIKWIYFTVPALFIKIFGHKKQKAVNNSITVCVCQNCGYTWKIKKRHIFLKIITIIIIIIFGLTIFGLTYDAITCDGRRYINVNSISIVETMKENDNLDNINVGDIVNFGEYKNERIYWEVLDIKDDKILLCVKYIIYFKNGDEYVKLTNPDNSLQMSSIWENCSLRKWLNNEFYNSAFSDEEKVLIKETTLHNESNPKYGTSGGNDTVDKLFILSPNEIIKYYPTKEERRFHDAYGYGSETYYARLPGENDKSTVTIEYGEINYSGENLQSVPVRPAVWISSR